jgi:hypothetical protein
MLQLHLSKILYMYTIIFLKQFPYIQEYVNYVLQMFMRNISIHQNICIHLILIEKFGLDFTENF